jgi:PTH2 family peptidyl-tRNA hydrolase
MKEFIMNIEDKPKQVIVIRKDLHMRRGKEIAQGSHASMGAILKLMDLYYETDEKICKNMIYDKDSAVGSWLDNSFTKICLCVNSEEEIIALSKQADDLGILNCLITDSGATEFHGIPTITALAIGPDWSSKIDTITKELKLY